MLKEIMQKSGLGVGGASRQGKPKTNAERRLSHGKGKLPSRGTGHKKQQGGDIYTHIANM